MADDDGGISEKEGYRRFRDAVLAGSSPDNPLDNPPRRAMAAAAHLRAQAEEAAASVRRTEGLVAKVKEAAERDVAAAEEALETARDVAREAEREADWAVEIVKDVSVESPPPAGDRIIRASVAEGRG